MVGDVRELARAFERQGRKPLAPHGRHLPRGREQFARFLDRQELPSRAVRLRREHVEDYIADVLARWKPSTASNRFRALQQFFKYLFDEGELEATPWPR